MTNIHEIPGALVLKSGVCATGIRPETLLIIQAAIPLFAIEGVACIVTSINDGAHSRKSLHNAGAAVDFRTRHLDHEAQVRVAIRLGGALQNDFDVILEGFDKNGIPNGTTEHIHAEWQPESRT